MPATPRDVLLAVSVLDLAGRPTGFDPLELLHDLTAHAVALVKVPAAGITVLRTDGKVACATASNERCRYLTDYQFEVDEGPCLDTARSQTPLRPTGLTPGSLGASRWPRFASRAVRAGISAIAAVPLRTADQTIGALNLMIAAPPMPTRHDVRLAQTLADAATVCFLHRQELRHRDTLIGQLQTALDSRVVIEQAKGVLSDRLRVGVDEAFTRLRAHARSRRKKLSALAAEVARGDVPEELTGPR
ncbi:transcriptional regulator [Streptomyces fumigatiscleroticus]|nr:transcriptional regulator [Streptomyces fumigatiscleroticus]